MFPTVHRPRLIRLGSEVPQRELHRCCQAGAAMLPCCHHCLCAHYSGALAAGMGVGGWGLEAAAVQAKAAVMLLHGPGAHNFGSAADAVYELDCGAGRGRVCACWAEAAVLQSLCLAAHGLATAAGMREADSAAPVPAAVVRQLELCLCVVLHTPWALL